MAVPAPNAETARAPESFSWVSQIPVPYPKDYNTLIETARKSRFEPVYLNIPCPKEGCTSIARLRLKAWFVQRNCVLFDSAGVACYRQTPVPLAICEQCKSRFRVLPFEFLPFKTYSLPIIETVCNHYGKTGDGLRKTVNTIEGVAPHYSTLHGWLGGMGERALDKVQLKRDKAAIGHPSLPPTSTLVAETAKRKDLDLINRWNKTVHHIASWKYQSLFRKELLQSCLKLLWIAESLFQTSAYPLTLWQHWLIPVFYVPGWLFPSRNILTPIQLTELIDNVVILGSKNTQHRGPP